MGGGGRSFSHTEGAGGRGTTLFRVALAWELEVLVFIKDGCKYSPPSKRGRPKSFTVLRGVGVGVLNP